MDIEDMLSEVRERQVLYGLTYMRNLKEPPLPPKKRIRFVVIRGGEWGQLEEDGQKTQTSSYKINNS